MIQRDRLAAAERLLTQLAHEIRNPVANVRNCLEILRRRVHTDPEAREFADMAIDELLRMHELAEQMLDLHRPRDPTVRECDAGIVAREVASLMRVGLRDQEIEVSVTAEESAEAAVPPDTLKQILLNVTQNACEAMHAAGGVHLDVHREPQAVVVEVQDDGPGIHEEVLPRIFDPFFTTKSSVDGVGLGLFTAEGLLRGAGRSYNRVQPGRRHGRDLPNRASCSGHGRSQGRSRGGGLMGAGRLLLVDDDRAFRRSTGALLEQDGHDVAEASNASEAVEALKARTFDLILLDLRMPGLDGIRLVEVLREWGEDVPILMISGFGSVEAAVQAIHTGADDFLTKPVEPAVLSARVSELLERRPVTDGSQENTGGIVGRSPSIKRVFAAIERVAGTDTTVLIGGETGTGKELVARAIHDGSPRAQGPFLAVNCAALSEGVLESELFGHLKGAFTGAMRDREGLFQSADGGTLLLDEIGDMAPAMQHRLLRVLQEREVTPVGGAHPDSRGCAHHRRHQPRPQGRRRGGGVPRGPFLRLNVFRIDLPPLRERRSDLPLLVEHFLRNRGSAEAGAFVTSCSPLAMRKIQGYHWPGNVRELFAALESAQIQAGGGRVEAQHLPEEVRTAGGAGPSPLERYRHGGTMADERAAIEIALEEAEGQRSRAAEILGMGRTTLWRKMRTYGFIVEGDDSPDDSE